MDKDLLLRKWLNNDLTVAEEEAFKKENDYALNLEILETAKLHKASQFSAIEDFETFKTKYKTQNTPVKKLNWITPMLRIASALIIAFGVYFTFFSDSTIQVQTLASQKTTIELPDLSQIALNALSSVEYDKKNWDDNRTIELHGEAYFKVAKGKTFDVITTQGKVSVVGTQFNVKQREDHFEVKCFEGIVEVNSNTISKRLLAGDTFTVFEGKFTEGKTLTSEPEWTKNSSVFNAMPIRVVIAELERQYDVEVNYRNIDPDRLFTGGFTHNNLRNALISITQPMNMTYELNSEKLVIINGQN